MRAAKVRGRTRGRVLHVAHHTVHGCRRCCCRSTLSFVSGQFTTHSVQAPGRVPAARKRRHRQGSRNQPQNKPVGRRCRQSTGRSCCSRSRCRTPTSNPVLSLSSRQMECSCTLQEAASAEAAATTGTRRQGSQNQPQSKTADRRCGRSTRRSCCSRY